LTPSVVIDGDAMLEEVDSKRVYSASVRTGEFPSGGCGQPTAAIFRLVVGRSWDKNHMFLVQLVCKAKKADVD